MKLQSRRIRQVNYFKNDLDWSQKNAGCPAWEGIYRQAFPNLRKIVDVSRDMQLQRRGIDRLVYLKSNRTARGVDEKVRRKYYAIDPRLGGYDVALEYVSVDTTQKPGWVVNPKDAGFIAYVVLPLGKGVFLPAPFLQWAWACNSDAWLRKYGSRPARNDGYTTLICPVPVNALAAIMGDCIIPITFNPSDFGF